jgi:histidine ammonia-lyase
MKSEIIIDGNSLSIEDVVLCARNPEIKVKIEDKAIGKVKESAENIKKLLEKEKPIYGVNTGFGSKENIIIEKDKREKLQRNLILSHCAGVGKPADIETVRAMLLLRANTLVKGSSGIRLKIIETLLKMLNEGVYPIIPEKGSVGASGDLAPLAHLALVLSCGDDNESGEALYKGKRISGEEAMKNAHIERIRLRPKEGLALINGSQFSTAIGVLALYDAENLISHSIFSAAMSIESLLGFDNAFKEDLLNLRPYKGMLEVGERIRRLTQGSELIGSDKNHIQDGYSLRCIPQVVGSVLDATKYVRSILEVEINSVTDNPIIIKNKAISGGNFHGEPIAISMDILSIAMSILGNISERRIFRLLSSFLSRGLPSFLSKRPGLESGFMLAQYTAASLVSENKALSFPASVDSIPTSEDQEDYVSMAPIAARKAREITKNTRKIIAIELLTAAEALEMRMKKTGKHPGKKNFLVYKKIRENISSLDKDRVLSRDIAIIEKMIKNREIREAVNRKS